MKNREIPAVYFFLLSYVSGLLLCQAGLFFLPLIFLVFCKQKVWKGLGLCSLVIVTGALSVWLRRPENDPKHYLNVPTQKYLRVELCTEAEERDKSFRAQGRVLATGNDSLWQERSGLIRLYFRKDSSLPLPRCGDVLVVCADIKPIEGFVGSDGKYFDYAAFMAKKQVYGQIFLSADDYRIEATKPSPWMRVKRVAWQLRGNLRRFFEKCNLRSDELAVAKALVLGERGSDPIEEAYRKSGIIHILAVSGMHLSIFSCLLAGVLAFLKRKAWQRWLRFLIVLFFVWGYALLTGLSPSVCRAACMFGFVGFGECVERKGRSLRSLAVSALFLLLIDPGYLHDAGFLLSYAAVAGLIFLSPVFSKFWQPSGKVPCFFRDLAAASLAAQVATLPISLCLFGTFPTYFLIGNCLIAPLVNIVLPFGIAVAALSFAWEAAALLLADVFGFLIRCMNQMAMMIQDWPAAMANLSVSLPVAVLLYGVVQGFYLAAKNHSAPLLRRSMLLLLLVLWVG